MIYHLNKEILIDNMGDVCLFVRYIIILRLQGCRRYQSCFKHFVTFLLNDCFLISVSDGAF